MSDGNVARSLRWFEEVWNERRVGTVDELLTEHSVAETENGILRGTEDFKNQVHGPMLAAFPDLKINIEGTLSEGDQVAIRWRATGTHTGDGIGIAPTGRPISLRGVTWFRHQEEKIVQGWDYWSREALMSQLQGDRQLAPDVG